MSSRRQMRQQGRPPARRTEALPSGDKWISSWRAAVQQAMYSEAARCEWWRRGAQETAWRRSGPPRFAGMQSEMRATSACAFEGAAQKHAATAD